MAKFHDTVAAWESIHLTAIGDAVSAQIKIRAHTHW